MNKKFLITILFALTTMMGWAQSICSVKATMDDYITKVWDYPGTWYVNFSLPAGFDSMEALIENLASETVKYYLSKRSS